MNVACGAWLDLRSIKMPYSSDAETRRRGDAATDMLAKVIAASPCRLHAASRRRLAPAFKGLVIAAVQDTLLQDQRLPVERTAQAGSLVGLLVRELGGHHALVLAQEAFSLLVIPAKSFA